jgi:transcriptional regulator
MYVPQRFSVPELAEVHEYMRRYGFAILVTQGADGMAATHLPILLDASALPHGRLLGHMARANRQWREVTGEALVIFPGPHAYVSASWYETPGTVPTWNYVTVHAYGKFRLIEDGERVHEILRRLTAVYEGGKSQPWTYDPADPAFNNLLTEIVAFEIEITRLEGKHKLNQNHPEERRRKVINALQSRPDSDSQAIAKLMAEMLDGGAVPPVE